MKHLLEFEELNEGKYTQGDFPMNFTRGQLNYWTTIINTNPNKFKYAKKVLDTIKKHKDNRVTWAQYQILKRAQGGNTTRYAHKN